jgi:hypothetical protein
MSAKNLVNGSNNSGNIYILQHGCKNCRLIERQIFYITQHFIIN